MSVVLLVVAMAAAVNPFRSRLGLRSEPLALVPLTVGVVVGLGGVALLAVIAPDLLSLLQVTPEMFLIAGGLVAIVAGARSVFFPRPFEEPTLPGWREGLWPIAFPRILSAEVMVLTIALVSQRGTGTTIAAAAVGVGALAVLSRIKVAGWTGRLLAACGQVSAALLMTVGIWMMIEGIRDV